MPNSGIAGSRLRELSVAREQRTTAAAAPNVLHLLQRTQRGLHNAVLFLMAFDQANRITGLTERTAQ